MAIPAKPNRNDANEGGRHPGDKSGSELNKANTATEEQTINQSGDPGRTPGSAEGVEDFQETGNE